MELLEKFIAIHFAQKLSVLWVFFYNIIFLGIFTIKYCTGHKCEVLFVCFILFLMIGLVSLVQRIFHHLLAFHIHLIDFAFWSRTE